MKNLRQDMTGLTSRYHMLTLIRLDTGIAQFAWWIIAQDFSDIRDTLTPDNFAQTLEDILVSKLNQYCPQKTVRLGSQDNAWVNKDIKQISRQK